MARLQPHGRTPPDFPSLGAVAPHSHARTQGPPRLDAQGLSPSHNRERVNSALPPVWGAGVEENGGVSSTSISKPELTGPCGPGTLPFFPPLRFLIYLKMKK